MGIVTIESSLARLEGAISRIERLSDAGANAAATRARAYDKLDSRHEMLRARVTETIARLDTLIAETPRSDGVLADGAAH